MLRAALDAAGPLLTADGHLIALFLGPDDALLESVCLAASGAGYALEGWGWAPEVGYRLAWCWQPGMGDREPQVAEADIDTLGRDLMAATEEVVVTVLRERGEPTAWPLLHAGAYAGLAERGLLARTAEVPEGGPPALTFAADVVRRGFEAARVIQFANQAGVQEALWWLADPGRPVEPPLADRVEDLVWALLAQQPWDPEALVEAVYARFPGSLTPDLKLVQVCVDSYSVQEGETLRLRPEDDPQRRAAELKTLRGELAELGKRLGFKVRRRGGWDVRWLEEGREAYVFAISATAALGPRLLTFPAGGEAEDGVADEGARRCLVVPGGRAQLVGLKLQRDPRLARAVEAGGFQFIKFRHLRRLVAEEELDRHALKTVLGLDPLVEQEAAQIPLF